MNIKYKTFLILILTFLCVLSSAQAVQTLIDRSFDNGENFTIDQVTWTAVIASNVDKERLMVKSLFTIFVIDKGRCEKVDYYNFCFNGIDTGEFELYKKAKLVVSKQDCVAYNNSDNQSVCKTTLAGSCIKDYDCLSNKCLHGMCIMKTATSLCGDGYCDKDEGCRSDCLQDISVTSTNPYTVVLAPKYDWVGTRFIIRNSTKYTLDSNSTYYIDAITQVNISGIKDLSNESLYPEFNKGALIGILCNETILLSATKTIKIDDDCELFLRVNEKKIYDNSGKITVVITPTEIQEKIDAEKKNLELELQKAKDQLKAAEASKASSVVIQQSPVVPVVAKKESSSSGGWFFLIILLGIGGYFLYKHKKGQINSAGSQIRRLNEQFENISKKKDTLINEYNERVEQIKTADMAKQKKDEELKQAQEELEVKEKQLNSKISEISRELNEVNDTYSKKLTEKIKLENEIQKLDKQNALLNKEKVEKELILEEKKHHKEELKAKFREAVKLANEEYSGKDLEKEVASLKEDLISEEKKIDATIDNVKQMVTEKSQKQSQNKQKKEELKEESQQKKTEIQKIEKSLESAVLGDKKILKSYISDKKDAKSYVEFKDNYSKDFVHCKTWPDHIKIYVQLFKGNDKLLVHLTTLLMEKEKSDNYDFALKQLKTLYKVELSKHSNNLIEDLKEIDSMTGLEFEEYLRKLFIALDYSVEKTKATRDGGIDIILKKEGRTTLIQAKKYKINGIVGVDAVRDVHSNASKYNASELIVLTTAMNFSNDARKDASEKNVDLWNRDKLKELLKKAKMIKNGQD